MKVWFLAAVIIGTVAASPAWSQWLYDGQQSAFGGGGTHSAYTGNRDYGFGFRCDDSEVSVAYLTPQPIESDDLDGYQRLPIRLLVRVDDNPVKEYESRIDRADEKLRVIADIERDILEEVRDAKRRIAVAINLAGKLYHEQSFRAQGSTATLNKFMPNCKTVQ